MSTLRFLTWGYWLLTLALFAATVTMVFTYTPVEETMGVVQKIFYLHLPVAINTFAAAAMVFIASIGYLWERKAWWDDLAAAAGKITALLCAVVLLTGMIWGRSAWGHWWTWSPRLTFSLVLFLLYVVYLMIRPSIESPQRRAMVCAVYGIIAFLDVPLVYLSVKMMPDFHPSSIALAPPMKLTLLAWFLPVTLLAAGLIVTRFTLNCRLRELGERREEEAHQPATEPLGGIA
ncbi:MAG: cytochrome c biogenesis protein CcsA [Phycisphaerales bacterium]|nr:MAG: cytochrome c biogenesis protein CcsA [Phycisphaerales bacterium]